MNKIKKVKDIKFAQKPNASWAFEVEKLNAWAYWDKAFTPEECKKIIDYAEQFEKKDAGVSNKNELNFEIRESKVVWITPDPQINWVYQRLTDIITRLNEDYFRFDLFGFTEGFQFTEYNAPSGHYGKHVDNIYNGTVRKLSFVLQLSDPKYYKGGELQIYLGEKPEVMKKEQGTVVAFPSPTLHEVTPIIEGRRYSLVGWITGKPFK
jgi:PKHD-type hydroxylase